MQQEETEGITDNEAVWFNIKSRVAQRMRAKKKNPNKTNHKQLRGKKMQMLLKNRFFLSSDV